MTFGPESLRLQDERMVTLRNIVDDSTRGLVRGFTRAWDATAADLEAALIEAAAQTQTGKRLTWRQLDRIERFQAAMRRLAESLDDLAATGRVEIVGSTGDAVSVAREFEPRLIASQLPSPLGPTDVIAAQLADRVAGPAFDQIVTRSQQRIVSLLQPLSADAQAQMRRELIRGITVGDNPRTAARRMLQRLESRFAGGLTRALRVARTEMLDAYRLGNQTVDVANADVVSGWTWISALDATTCPACFAMHGRTFPTDVPGPEGHVNCFPAGTEVSGPPVKGATARWFAGDLVDIRTVGGRHLSVTPGHPILTSQGFVAAGELRQGHDLVCHDLAHRPASYVNPNDQHRPARIEDVAVTLGGPSPVPSVRMPTAPEDFHGDGVGSEVHVVRTNRLLGDRLDAPVSEPPLQELLGRRDVGSALLTGTGTAAQTLPRVDVPAPSVMGVRGEGAVLLGGALRSEEPVGLGVAAPFDAGVVENPVDDTTADVVAFRQSLDRYAGAVVLDEVVEVRRHPFAGHVYNLQTNDSWYSANTVIVHNCRCDRAPTTRSWDELGFVGLEEPASMIPNARDTFDALPAATQRQIMGPTRLGALQSGEIGWDELARRVDNPDWRPSWNVTPLYDLGVELERTTA